MKIINKSMVLYFDTNEKTITLWDKKRNQRLIISPMEGWFCPVLNEKKENVKFCSVRKKENILSINFSSERILDFNVSFELKDFLKISSYFTLNDDLQLNRLNLLPEGARINLYDLVNFRNRHFTPNTWPELLLGGSGCETNTYSTDWQFAPHPSMFIFKKDAANLFWGALSLPDSFGMYIKINDYRTKYWYLDYGSNENGLELKKGEKYFSPDFCIFLDNNRTVYETLDKYKNILSAEKYVPAPSSKKTYPWHTESLYCTWIDQIYMENIEVPAELYQQERITKKSIELMDEKFVRKTLKVIKEEKLPFKTILLDDGWQVTRGQWEPHPEKFPNLRKLVDEIHSLGMKVIVWWNWAEVYDDAMVNPAHLMAGEKRNKHGRRMVDYSNPKTQKEYLEPLFYKLFSGDKDCFDVDGVKTDFLADKVHPDMPVYDKNWRGEEKYFFNVFKLFYTIMKGFKKDACHIGCAGHPYLSQFIDVNRTYDVANSDYREHLNRALMLKHTNIQTTVAFDFHTYLENLEEYFKSAYDNDCSIQIGNVLGMKKDIFSSWEKADANYYKLLRKYLKKFNCEKK